MAEKKQSRSKKRPSSDDIKGMLLEGNFGSSSEDGPLPLTDPISTTQMVLKLKDIKTYDKDPRREKNPRYEEIKASIRSKKKLNNPFNVTRRPGDDLFMVESGGNTRLTILNELYMETADEDFNTIHSLFIPWVSEAVILTAHLIENTLRGEMVLIDKAYAIQELKRELEKEEGEEISDRKFITLLSEGGYKISRTHLRRFNYAIKLDQMIPQVLRTGIGGHKLDYIKKVEAAYCQYSEGKNISIQQFEAAFMAVMQESDSHDEWDFDSVRYDLDERLSELTGVRTGLLHLEVDAIISNVQINDAEKRQVRDSIEQSIIEEEQTALSGSTLKAESPPMQSHGKEINTGNNTHVNMVEDDRQVSDKIMTGDTSSFQIEQPAQSKLEPDSLAPKNTEIQLKILREKGHSLAIKIATPAGLEPSVMLVKSGMGFFMESPQKLSFGTRAYYTWWLLFGISEQNAKSSDTDNTHFPMWEYTDIYNKLALEQNNNDGSLNEWIDYDPGVMSIPFDFFHNHELINDQIFTLVFQLMENCRKIRRNFSLHDIWENPK